MQTSSDKIDDDSIKHLQDVKKGKARKFVMIKEGVQIDRLYVFKKGPFDRFVRKAKQDGVRGEAFWGVVRGDGNDIHFELSRTDGFENPPGKDIRLKEFLKEETQFKFEPDYVIVDELTAVDESDGEADADAADANETQDAATAVATEDTGAKFIDLLKKILPHVKRALAKPTSVSAELQSRVREAQDFGRQREFEQGLATLRIVGQLTKQALAESEATPAAGGDASGLKQQLSSLRSSADEAGAGESLVGKDLAQCLDDGAAFAQRGQIDRANRSLRRAERLLELARAEGERRQQWQERYVGLQPQSDQAIQAAAPNANQIRAIMDYSMRQAERQQFMKALVALNRLETLLGGAV
jgi:hypothetical protein